MEQANIIQCIYNIKYHRHFRETDIPIEISYIIQYCKKVVSIGTVSLFHMNNFDDYDIRYVCVYIHIHTQYTCININMMVYLNKLQNSILHCCHCWYIDALQQYNNGGCEVMFIRQPARLAPRWGRRSPLLHPRLSPALVVVVVAPFLPRSPRFRWGRLVQCLCQ